MYSSAIFVACLASVSLLPMAEARAALITRTFTFSASGDGVPWPVDPAVGSVTITWNNDVDTSDATTGIVINALNLPLASPLGFSYVAATDEMAIGGMDGGVGLLSSFVDDLSIVFTQASGSPQSGDLFFSSAGSPSIFHASLDAIEIAEPVSLALLGGALLGMALVRRRRTSHRTS